VEERITGATPVAIGRLLDGANKLCDQYAIDPRRILVSTLPDHYEKAYAASLRNTGPKPPEKHDSNTERVTDSLQKTMESKIALAQPRRSVAIQPN
jgi:hypothetical protein